MPLIGLAPLLIFSQSCLEIGSGFHFSHEGLAIADIDQIDGIFCSYPISATNYNIARPLKG